MRRLIECVVAVLVLGLSACSSGPTEPCELQTRWLAEYEHYETVCWLVYQGPEGTVINCIVWPDDGGIPDWFGDFAAMQERKILREVRVCKETPLGAEGRWGGWCRASFVTTVRGSVVPIGTIPPL